MMIFQEMKQALRYRYLSIRFKLHIMSTLDTIAYIQKYRCSLARFGDGELNMIMTDKSIGFQKHSQVLAKRLEEVLLSDDTNLLRCLPHTLDRFDREVRKAKHFWTRFVVYNKPYIYHLLNDNKKGKYLFGDTQVTRPYIDYLNVARAEKVYGGIKQLWTDQNVMIVEGSATCMGIGNDLFNNALSVTRIICPAENAFDAYDRILQSVLKNHNDEMVLIALGPTATVLAADLSRKGIWAMDVGHLDVEYEWFRCKVAEKTEIKGKYVNEVNGGNRQEMCEDVDYLTQIKDRICL